MRFWIDRHGCAKNDVDGEEMAARLEAAGHGYSELPAEADLLIVNTCGFIEDAKKESIEAVLALKAAYPGKRILVAGCLAQRYAAELAVDLPEADGIFGNADLAQVLAAAEATLSGERPVIVPEAAPSIGTVRRGAALRLPGHRPCQGDRRLLQWLQLLRHPPHPRTPSLPAVADVLAECLDLVAQGVQGARPHRPGPRLLRPRLRRRHPACPSSSSRLSPSGRFPRRALSTSTPTTFPRRILHVMAADPRLVPYFDLPFQHASARHPQGDEQEGGAGSATSSSSRGSAPSPARRGDPIDLPPRLPRRERTRTSRSCATFQEAARLDWAGTFAYSREEGTAAYGMRGLPARKAVAARRAAIEEAQERITRERLGRFVGRELEVLIEEMVEPTSGGDAADEELSLGRAWNQAPEVDGLTVLRGSHVPGTIVRARVLAVNGVDFDALPV